MRNLFVDYFPCKDNHRKSEYEFCLKKNSELDYFDNIYLITNIEPPFSSPKFKTIPCFRDRTFYQDIFNLDIFTDDSINMIANSDIYFDESISKVDNVLTNEVALGLSRTYPKDDFYIKVGFHHNGKASPGSNDVWIWRGKCKVKNGNFEVGYTACDCRIMQCFVEADYRVYNPAKSIQVWHKHTIRKGDGPPRVDGPYWHSPNDHHTIEDVK